MPRVVNSKKLYCKLATSEMHEKNYCEANDGAMSAYGSDEQGMFDTHGWVDYLIGNWVDYTE